MKYRTIIILFTALTLMFSTALSAKSIKIKDLPKAVVESIKKVYPQLELEKAKVRDKRGTLIYKVKGEYEADGGKILDVDEEFEDDSDD